MADGDLFPIPQSQYQGVIVSPSTAHGYFICTIVLQVINVFAILSSVALLSVALRVLWLAIRKLWKVDAFESQEYIFFQTQLGNYAACLLVGDMMSSTAGLMGLPWLLQKGITDGKYIHFPELCVQLNNHLRCGMSSTRQMT